MSFQSKYRLPEDCHFPEHFFDVKFWRLSRQNAFRARNQHYISEYVTQPFSPLYGLHKDFDIWGKRKS
jgi:hypothetical protein